MTNKKKNLVLFLTLDQEVYVCTKLLTKLKLEPIKREKKTIEQLHGSANKNIEI